MTVDALIEMVYALPPEDRRGAEFYCGAVQARELMRLHDDDGRFVFSAASDKTQRPTVLGYPLNVGGHNEPVRFGQPTKEQ